MAIMPLEITRLVVTILQALKKAFFDGSHGVLVLRWMNESVYFTKALQGVLKLSQVDLLGRIARSIRFILDRDLCQFIAKFSLELRSSGAPKPFEEAAKILQVTIPWIHR